MTYTVDISLPTYCRYCGAEMPTRTDQHGTERIDLDGVITHLGDEHADVFPFPPEGDTCPG